MTTERLYYDDSYLTEFTAHVVDRRADANAAFVALDRTAFYPEGGGQPSDHGTLDGVPVTDVQAAADGTVWHRVEREIMAERVQGIVDWRRRFDHMQQHHGQHLLSAAFENLFGYGTTSFHLGAHRVTIDLATPAVSDDELRRAEAEANSVVWQNRAIHARFVAPEELACLDLRKQPKVSGPVRIVSVADFDHSPCGGTHPNATGAVGMIHLSKTERRGDETRIEFACGRRLLEDVRTHEATLKRLASTLTVGVHELEDAVRRLGDSETSNRRQLEAAKKELMRYEVSALLQSAEPVKGSLAVVCRRYDGRPVAELQALAVALTNEGGIAVLGTTNDRAQLVVARPDGTDFDCAALLKTTLAARGGGGGGRAALASGGLPDPQALDSAMAHIVAQITRAVSPSP